MTALGHDEFQAGVGWLNRFRGRNGIVGKLLCGERNDVLLNKVIEWRANEIRKVISEFRPDDIYNAYETGIFYQVLTTRAHSYIQTRYL